MTLCREQLISNTVELALTSRGYRSKPIERRSKTLSWTSRRDWRIWIRSSRGRRINCNAQNHEKQWADRVSDAFAQGRHAAFICKYLVEILGLRQIGEWAKIKAETFVRYSDQRSQREHMYTETTLATTALPVFVWFQSRPPDQDGRIRSMLFEGRNPAIASLLWPAATGDYVLKICSQLCLRR